MLTPAPFSEPLLPPPQTIQQGIDQSSVVNETTDHDRQRKRNYLALLPPDQIIELCLKFESHVPLPIRTSLWPPDIDAEISTLKTNGTRVASGPDPIAQPTKGTEDTTPIQQFHPPGSASAFELPVQPLDTSFPTSSGDVGEHSELVADAPKVAPSTVETPPAATVSSTQHEQHSPSSPQRVAAVSVESSVNVAALGTGSQSPDATNEAASSSRLPVENAVASSSTATPASGTPVAAAVPPYPYAPYGYAPPPGYAAHAAYPHTPYYSSSSAVSAYYPGYPSYTPPTGYTAPQPPPPISNEDLPSYEDMIVEALIDIGDPEGAAPKDLFLWMGSRWPLQTNFRPSASQALQKAYKRGRLEKMSGGRYRLNPNWEGGATSKRTTRRPQTLAQTTYALHHGTSSQTPSSPFTTAPLPPRSHTSPPTPHPSQHQPYTGYAYPYGSYHGYPGYTPYAHPAAKVPNASTTSTIAPKPAATSSTASKTVSSATTKEKDVSTVDESDAWVAAQHILKAINFRSLQSTPTINATAKPVTDSAPVGGRDAFHTPPAMASLGKDTEDDGLGRATLTDDERASLQAQLALLAAQLSEIAAEEDEEPIQAVEEVQHRVHPAHSEPQSESRPPPATIQEGLARASSTLMDVNQFPDDTDDGFTLFYPQGQQSTDSANPVQTEVPSVSLERAQSDAIPPPADLAVTPLPAESAPSAAPAVETPPPANDVMDAESEEDDDDMEMVDVDSYMRSEGIRT